MEYQKEQHIVMPQDQLMDEAKAALTGKWGMGAAAFLIMALVSLIGEFDGIGDLISLLLLGPLSVGMAMFYLMISREEEDVELGVVFDGFKLFGKAVGAYILMLLAILVGFILLVIPGFIVAFGLAQTFFIIADDPEIGVIDALKYSWELMDGHKFDYFILMLRFLGWGFLSILTIGIGFFFLVPYFQTTAAKFYNSIRYGDHNLGPGDYEDDIINHLVD